MSHAAVAQPRLCVTTPARMHSRALRARTVPAARAGLQRALAAEAAAATEEQAAPAAAAPRWEAPPIAPEHAQRNAALVEALRGKLILAPLTRGGNLPFRRLCADFGADVTMSEMAFARQLVRGAPKEKAILRRAANEACYGVQIATNVIDEGVAAGRMAAKAAAAFIDLNCGCPIHEATRRGLGSTLLRRPAKLARLVQGIAEQLPIPLTVKIRLGENSSKINAQEVVPLLLASGAAAVTVHGRTAEQRYKKAADWALISRLADGAASSELGDSSASAKQAAVAKAAGAEAAGGLPVIGNGDVLTHYEAARRLQGSGCLAVMVGRGALIRPWIWQELREGRELNPSAAERVGIYRRLVSHMKEHFGDDAKGKRKADYFLPWHFNFLCRHRPFPEDVYGPLSLQHPLIATRWASAAAVEAGEMLESLSPLERLLRCEAEAAHGPVAEALWEASSDTDAIAALEALAAAELAGWDEEARQGRRGSEDSQSEG